MKKNKAYLEYIGVFLLAAWPKIWLALQAVPLKTFSDEVATVASAAALAGYDWSAVVSQAGYYGAGFYWIFAPIFMLTDNPVIIYRAVLVGCSLVQALIAPICCYMLKHYFRVEDNRYRIAVSFACSFLVMTRGSILFNEHMLILLVWLSVLVLAKLYEYKDNVWKKRAYTVLLMGLFSYSMTIHTRMLTFWIALALLLVAYAIVERKILVSKSMLILVGPAGYWFSGKLVSFVQGILWNTNNGGELRNASVTVSLSHDFLSLRTWKAWISIIIGQVETVNLVTGGIAVLLLVAFGVYLFDWIKRKKEQSEYKEDIYYLIIMFFCICCTGMTIAAQSLSWLSGAAYGISHGFNSSDYGLKAYIYLRYFGLYTGPILMCGMAILKQFRENNKKVVLITVPLSMFFFVAWMVLIQPYIFENRDTSEFISGMSLYWPTDKVELRHYLIGIVCMLIVGILLYSLVWEQKYIQLAGVLGVYLLAQYYMNGLAYDINRAERNMFSANGGYKAVQDLEEETNLPKQIYYYDGVEKTDHYLFYLYQFYLNRYEIQPVTPDNLEEVPDDVIIFSNTKDDETLLSKGYTCFRVDNNEYVYVESGNPEVFEYFENRS